MSHKCRITVRNTTDAILFINTNAYEFYPELLEAALTLLAHEFIGSQSTHAKATLATNQPHHTFIISSLME